MKMGQGGANEGGRGRVSWTSRRLCCTVVTRNLGFLLPLARAILLLRSRSGGAAFAIFNSAIGGKYVVIFELKT